MNYETKFAVEAIVNYEFAAPILHTKLTENKFIACCVEHFEYKLLNIDCRCVLPFFDLYITLLNIGRSLSFDR
jgi:hypothetical protein